MEEWVKVLVAFVNDDREFDFDARDVQEMKKVTSSGNSEVHKDER